jgi:hypothetical protein
MQASGAAISRTVPGEASADTFSFLSRAASKDASVSNSVSTALPPHVEASSPPDAMSSMIRLFVMRLTYLP